MPTSETSRETLCILGCGGFIGSHLTRALLNSGRYDIIGLDIDDSKIPDCLQHPLLTFVNANIYDSTLLKKHITQCDTVISLVALCNPALYNTIPLQVINSNFIQPLELVKICAELKKRLIHFSTCEVYGKTVQGLAGDALKNPNAPGNYILKEDESPNILGPVSAQRWSYASAKELLERVIYAYGAEGTLNYTIIRPFNFIGPRMDFIPGVDEEGIPRVLACFMDALMFKKPLKLVDGGENRRCFTSIYDAVDAIIRIVRLPKHANNQIFNIGNPNNEISIAGLAKKMMEIFLRITPSKTEPLPEIVHVSSKEFYGEGYEDSDRRIPDISKAQNLLGWVPKISLDEALTDAIHSYLQFYL